MKNLKQYNGLGSLSQNGKCSGILGGELNPELPASQEYETYVGIEEIVPESALNSKDLLYPPGTNQDGLSRSGQGTSNINLSSYYLNLSKRPSLSQKGNPQALSSFFNFSHVPCFTSSPNLRQPIEH